MKRIAIASILLMSLYACQTNPEDTHESHSHHYSDGHIHDESVELPADTLQETFFMENDTSNQLN